MANDVFVSYPSTEKTTADAVVAALEAAGTRCWIAPRDVPVGADWAGSIVGAIEHSRLMVLVFSDATNESSHILREVREAADAGIPILPFRITPTEPSPALQYYVGGTHWLDALTPDLEAHLTQLTDQVAELLTDHPDEPRPKPARTPVGGPARQSNTALAVVGTLIAIAILLLAGTWLFGPDAGEPPPDAAPTSPSTTGAGAGAATTESPSLPTTTRVHTTTIANPAVALDEVDESGFVPSLLALAMEFAPSRICTIGVGSPTCTEIPSEGEPFLDTGLGDFDGDGLVDVVFAVGAEVRDPETFEVVRTLESPRNTLCRNLGSDGWACSKLPDSDAASGGITVADLDADGNLDILVENAGLSYGQESLLRAEVCLGDGGGGFECSPLADTRLDTAGGGGPGIGVNGSAIADLDGNGTLDVVLAGWVEIHEVCLGEGDGTFRCAELTSEREGTFTSVAIGDPDADGVPDIVFGSSQTPTRWCRGLGGGAFSCEDLSEPFIETWSTYVLDIDDDGYDDALFAQAWIDEPGGLEACFGPLIPGVRCERTVLTEDGDLQQRLVIADVDGDSMTDLMYSHHGNAIDLCTTTSDRTLSCGALPQEVAGEAMDDRGFLRPVFITAIAWAPLP